MNIFVLSEDPVQAARDQCNKHILKMLVESAQILCTALALKGVDRTLLPYRSTHAKHPSTIWTASNENNMVWLWKHAIELCNEYERRYHKTHKTSYALNKISKLIPTGDWHLHTPFAQAMPNEWKNDDVVTAYRCYYIAEKSRFAKWHPRSKAPDWWPFKEDQQT